MLIKYISVRTLSNKCKSIKKFLFEEIIYKKIDIIAEIYKKYI
jgi:hypothetical protein